MSYVEWVSRNGRGRLRIYSDAALHMFDKLTGDQATRHENAMIEHEDSQTDQRLRTVAEQCIVWEEGRRVFVELRGRRISQTEPLSTRHGIPIPRRNRQPIGVYEDR